MSMSPIYFPEQDNADAVTSAPFTCFPACTSGDTEVQLPYSLVLSGHVASAWPLWLSSITAGVLRLSRAVDAENNEEVATCVITLSGVSPVYSILTNTVIGAMVFGSAGNYSASATYVFEPRTVYLTADSLVPLYTGKVLSLADSEGHRAVGQVRILQGTGASVIGNPDNSITISFPFPVSTGSAFKYLVLEIYNNTLFNIAFTDGNITIDYSGASLDAVCVSNKVNELPDIDGNLPRFPYNQAADDPPASPIPPPLAPTLKHTIVIPLDQCNGALTLAAIPGPDYRSRLNITRTSDTEVTVSMLG